MSSKSFARPIDHKEYLRVKYGAGEDPQAKPRKKKKDIDELSKGTNFRIYDDDIELKKIKKKKVSDNLDVYFGVEEDRPVVEDIIDERPLAVKNKEKQGSKWKPLAADEEEMTSKDKDRVKKSRSSDGDRNKDFKKSKVSHGLTSAKEMREERKRLKDEEARMFGKLDPKISGKGVKSVYRDKKTGRIRDLEKEAAEAAAKEKEMEAKTAAERQKFKEKTAGIKQVEEAKQRADDEAIEMEKPFARYEDDPDLDNYLRELDKNKELIEDPMFEYFREQRQQKEKEVGLDDKKPKLIYKGSVPPPPNRFNIHPGHRWDGVDRSNGYEQKYFASLAEKEAIKEEAYRWSTEDM